ncbi:MAG TPA: hypothetical protein VGJ00_00635 [Rhabdochlamydiaceae bacterium]
MSNPIVTQTHNRGFVLNRDWPETVLYNRAGTSQQVRDRYRANRAYGNAQDPNDTPQGQIGIAIQRAAGPRTNPIAQAVRNLFQRIFA